MRVLTGFGTRRRLADAKIGIIRLRYPLDDQTAGLFGCLVFIDGPYRGTLLGIEVLLLNL